MLSTRHSPASSRPIWAWAIVDSKFAPLSSTPVVSMLVQAAFCVSSLSAQFAASRWFARGSINSRLLPPPADHSPQRPAGLDAELLADAAILRIALPAEDVKLILDDRADLVEQVGFDGAHVDAGDLPPEEARRLVGPNRIVGTFGGSETLLPGDQRS